MVAVDYVFPWDDIIARFKFRNEPGWANSLASLLLAAPGAHELMQQCEVMVPIPLTRQRLATRGYNQAWELTKALLRQMAVPASAAPCALPDALRRIGQAPDQHTLPREQRLRNLRGAFEAHPAHLARLQDRHLLLVDDVTTTGTTLNCAAQALQLAGATRVSALAFARTLPS